MAIRTLEAIFRHLFKFLALIVLLPCVGFAVTYFMVPRTYQSSASLWALYRYSVVGPNGSEYDLTATPASTQSNALQGLLQTRSFVLRVTQGIDLLPTLGVTSTDPEQQEKAVFDDISKNVQVIPQSTNLLSITYANRNARIAQQVVQSVILNYGLQSHSLSVTEGQNLLVGYQGDLQSAQQEENAAIAAEAQYAATHPQSPTQLAADPQYLSLDAKRVQALAKVQGLQGTINTIQQSMNVNGNSTNTLYQILDPPQLPVLPVSRLSKFLIGAGSGLGIALLAITIYLVILVRRDRAIYSADDLRDVVAIPVVMVLPEFTPGAVALLVSNAVND